jgi:iron complex outermembrane receptor protein
MTIRASSRGVLLGTSLLAGMAMASGAWAQAATPGNQLDELVVTGSRIPRPNLEQPTPVTVLSSQIIANAGPQNLGDIISLLPSVGYSGTVRANSNNFGNGAGVSSIDLRNLGLSRTLVLVDGQRHVAGDLTTNAVDVNSIPSALVDRVEVTTGGASAVYGSDAVTGVVNIILKKNFQGIEADAQVGGDDNGFGAKYSASVTAGQNFLNDRLNVAVTGFWSKEAGIDARNLPAAHNYGTITNPADIDPTTLDPSFYSSGVSIKNNGIPDRLYVQNVGSEFVTPNGALLNAATFLPQFSFNAAGQLIPTPARTGYNSFAFGQLPANCADCYFTEDYEQETSPLTSKGVALNAHMDFTDHLHGFVDAKIVQTDTENVVQPSYSFGDYQLQPDNAFIGSDLQAALAGTAPEDYPYIAKFLNTGRVQEARRRTYRIVAGLRGDFDAGFATINWDGALNYGENDARFRNSSLEITENFAAALDSVIDPATGQAACRINVASAAQTGIGADAANPAACVPFNPFGLNTNSAAAMAYSFGTFDTRDKLTQEDANFNLNFDSSRFFNLQGGPIGVAAGGEWRREHTKEVNDPELTEGLTENLASNSAGGFHVYEGYVEVSAPIFKHYGPFLDELTVDAAYRGAHYSTVGGVGSYKFSATYGPVSWMKLRGTYSRAIRAPNITEAFLPASSGFFNITDPCSAENIGNNVNYARNCAAAGIPGAFVANTNSSIIGTSSGNPNLNPEKSFSYTGGFVIQPPIVPGLAITLDYYSIKIKDAISLVSGQDVINNCYNASAGLAPEFCNLLTRGADNNINFVSTTYVNASKLKTNGLELQVNYSTDVSPLTGRWKWTAPLDGRLSIEATADYIFKLRDYPFQSDPTTYHVNEGTTNAPHLKALVNSTYTQGPVSLSWQVRYVGKQAIFDRDPTAADHSESLSVPFGEATFYHDIVAHYRFQDGAMRGTDVFAGVNNVFSEEPPFALIGTLSDLSYDLGRFIFVGVKFRR